MKRGRQVMQHVSRGIVVQATENARENNGRERPLHKEGAGAYAALHTSVGFVIAGGGTGGAMLEQLKEVKNNDCG